MALQHFYNKQALAVPKVETTQNWASLVAELVRSLPAMQETWVWSLGWEDPLEKGKAINTPVLWPREFLGLVHGGHKELDTTEWLLLSHKTRNR